MQGSNCCFLTWIQISQETGEMVWYSHLFKNFPVCCDSQSQRLWCSQWSRSRCFAGISLLSLWSNKWWQFSKPSLYTWNFLVHILLEPSLKDFEDDLVKHVEWVQLFCSMNILWHYPSLGMEWKLIFSSPVATAEFSKFADILSAALLQHHLLGFEIAQLEFCHLH